MNYTPANWYWKKADGSLYSSARNIAVDETDAAFLAWVEGGNLPTPYPRDTEGNESEDELAAVLRPYGLFVKLTDYAAAKRYSIEIGGIVVDGATIDTSRDSQNMITGAYSYAQANPNKTVQFKASSGWVSITSAQMIAIGEAVGDHVQACFAAESAVAADIASGKIKTVADVDNANWPQNH